MPAQIGILLPYRINNELAEFVEENLSLNAKLRFGGAQDGMTDDQLRELGKGISPNTYSETLEDGNTVFMTRKTAVAGMRKQAGELLAGGCDVVMVCCTLPWPELDDLASVVTPSAVLKNCIVSIAPKAGTIGILQPIREAMEDEIQQWLALGKEHSLEVVSEFAAPRVPGKSTESTEDSFEQAAQSLASKGADVIVLDCMAYTESHRALAARASGKPTLRAMSLTASVIEQAYCPIDR